MSSSVGSEGGLGADEEAGGGGVGAGAHGVRDAVHSEGGGGLVLPGEVAAPPLALARQNSVSSTGSSVSRQNSVGIARSASVGVVRGVSARFLESVHALERTFLCPVCFENQRTATQAYLPTACEHAEHTVCVGCAKAYVLTFLRAGGRVGELTCPGGEECGVVLQRGDVDRLGDASILQKFDDFSSKQSESGAADCPHCQRTNPRDPDDAKDPILTCAGCGKRYCFFHANAHPPDEPCTTYTRRVAKEEEAARKAMLRVAAPCPKCGVMIARTSGCQHMTHQGCCEFCMLCLEVLRHDKVEEHYALFNARGCPGLQFSTLAPGSMVRSEAARAREEGCIDCMEGTRWVCFPCLFLLSPVFLAICMGLGMVAMVVGMVLGLIAMPFAGVYCLITGADFDFISDLVLETCLAPSMGLIFAGPSLGLCVLHGPRSLAE